MDGFGFISGVIWTPTLRIYYKLFNASSAFDSVLLNFLQSLQELPPKTNRAIFPKDKDISNEVQSRLRKLL